MPENESKLAEVARVSTGKSSIFQPLAHSEQDDLELLRKIYKMRHLSVFEFAVVQVAVECPLFVSSQLLRYRCGSYLQESRRRVEPERIAEPQSSYATITTRLLSRIRRCLKTGKQKSKLDKCCRFMRRRSLSRNGIYAPCSTSLTSGSILTRKWERA